MEPLLMVRPSDGDARHAVGCREERLAFWINAYNRVVAEGIVRLALRDTVWDVPDFFDRIGCRVGEDVVSASDIEHGILRGNRPHPLATAPPFAPGDPRQRWTISPIDPRIHGAISCGARSCPAVRSYEPLGIDAQLDAAAGAFVAGQVTLEGERVAVSELFRWFANDFAGEPDGLAGFLLRHAPDGPVRRALRAQGLARVQWQPYDWRLEPGPHGPPSEAQWTGPA